MTPTEFLYLEAELLDDRRLSDWFALLTEDIEYRIPTRVTQERGADSGFSAKSFHMIDDYGSLRTRVARLESEFAFAENPASRTRRIVGNIRAAAGTRAGEFAVKSNLLLFRARGEGAPQLLAGERRDVLREVDGALRLARRTILLDHTALPMENLAVFL